MRFRHFFLAVVLTVAFQPVFAQSGGFGWTDPALRAGDAAIAAQYLNWARQAIDEGRWAHALAALERAADFSSASSDLSYLLALARYRQGQNRFTVLEALQRAISTDLWTHYSAADARLLQARQLVAMRNYHNALSVLELVPQSGDEAALRLLALRGIALYPALYYTDGEAANEGFLSGVLYAMNRHPRDPRPLSIFFEYALGNPHGVYEIPAGASGVMDLALRRLPFLLEDAPQLAWMAAPFIRDPEEARRLVGAYRAMAASGFLNGGAPVSPGSIPVALNLGLIDDWQAIEELFGGSLAAGGTPGAELTVAKSVLDQTWSLLRGHDGRELFTERLLSFTGVITRGDNGRIVSRAFYQDGSLMEYQRDANNFGMTDFRIVFGGAGEPLYAETFVFPDTAIGTPAFLPVIAAAALDERLRARVFWERYPSVQRVELDGSAYNFRPADFHFAPFSFYEIGGSGVFSGLLFPRVNDQNTRFARRALVMAAASIHRPSAEFPGATEIVYLEQGIPLRSFEELNGAVVSITEFEDGFPVVQHIDLDLDGRMETLRRFQRPPAGSDFFAVDLRSFIVSSVSDWRGDGRFTTSRVYLQDGSVVYSWDLDGSGYREHSEIRR
ncbi:MAG: tetratricopeptide repeat protein [Spirochaetes bacterium]|nr:tetratricopeptide repeat protein [Spirochaetota bacterium]